MNPINQSIKYLLLNSKLYLTILLVFILSIILVERVLTPEALDLKSVTSILKFSYQEIKSLYLLIAVAVFLGVYLGGGLANLKKNYLWKISKKYKDSLLHGFFIITVVVNAIVMLGLYPSIVNAKLILLLPFCLSVFASQMVLGKNILFKVLVTSIPFVIAQLYRFNVSLDVIVVLIVVATAVLIYTMYKNLFYQFGAQLKVEKNNNNENLVAFATTGLNAAQLNSINYRIGLIVAKWVTSSRKLIDWAILMPHTRLTLVTLFYLIFIFITMVLTSDKMRPLLPMFAFMVLPIIITGTLIESRNLFRQTRTIAHVFIGKQHRQLKNKILFSLDKNLMVNILIFILGVFLMIKVLSITIMFKTMMLSLVAIAVFSLSVYPYLLCLNWVNLSALLIGSMFIYITLIYKVIKWININPGLAMTWPYVISFIAVCLLLRGLTQYIFWRREFEVLLKT